MRLHQQLEIRLLCVIAVIRVIGPGSKLPRPLSLMVLDGNQVQAFPANPIHKDSGLDHKVGASVKHEVQISNTKELKLIIQWICLLKLEHDVCQLLPLQQVHSSKLNASLKEHESRSCEVNPS